MQNGTVTMYCESLLRKLKNNREKIGESVLKKRYANAYKRLLDEICEEVRELLYQFLFSGLCFSHVTDTELRKFIADAQGIINQEHEQLQKMSSIVFKEYDIVKALVSIESLKNRIFNEAYRNIFNVHCYKKDGKIGNDIINMIWSPEHQLWIAEDKCSASVMFPPSLDDCA